MTEKKPPISQTIRSSISGMSLRSKRHAGGDAHRQENDHQAVMRGGLDEGDRAEQHGDEQDDIEKPLRQRRGYGIAFVLGERRRARKLTQYAFSVRNSANGVCATMYRSSRIDQFSM